MLLIYQWFICGLSIVFSWISMVYRWVPMGATLQQSRCLFFFLSSKIGDRRRCPINEQWETHWWRELISEFLFRPSNEALWCL